MLRAAARQSHTCLSPRARLTVPARARTFSILKEVPALTSTPSSISNTRSLSRRSASTVTTSHPRTTAAKDLEFGVVQPDISHEPVDAQSPAIHSFFENVTGTWQYVLVDPATSEAAVVDSVLDYDPASGRVATVSADRLLAYIAQEGLTVTHILETHAHADHLTASQYLKKSLGGTMPVGIGGRITQVQRLFAPLYGFDDPALLERSFDVYFADDEEFRLGALTGRVVHLPGHTPDHVGYVIGKAVFSGDSIFNPDVGSARTDFPGGDAQDLHKSMQRLISLPEDTLLFVGHDYPPGARAPVTAAPVDEHRKTWADKLRDEQGWIAWRRQRDATLGAPRLLHPSLQVNIRGGRLPPKDEKGRRWFKTPVRGDAW